MIDLTDFICYLKEEERSKNTISTYITGLKTYFQKFNEITKPNLIEWKDWLKDNFKPNTINLRIIGMNEYLKFINQQDLSLKLVKKQQQMHTDNVISIEDYNKLIDGLLKDNNKKWYYIVRLLAETGVRVSELLKLKIENLDTCIVDMHTKASKCRRIYIKRSLGDELKNWLNSQGRYKGNIILNRFGNPMTSRGIDQSLKDLGERYDIDKRVMHAHSFRHFFAIQFLKKEQNISLLADLMGHSSISTTALYTRLSQKEQMEKLNEIVDW